MERCLGIAADARLRTSLQAWEMGVHLQLVPRTCAAAAAAALLEAVDLDEDGALGRLGALGRAHMASMHNHGAAYSPLTAAAPREGAAAASSSRREASARCDSPQYRPFEELAAPAAESSAAAGAADAGGAAPRHGAASVLDATVDEVRAAVGQLAAWLQHTATWGAAPSEPPSVQPSPLLSRAVLAASATSSPCGLLPRPGLAPRRLQLGATDAVDADEPAWLQSAADAVAAAARAPPHEAALACARRWAVENAVLVAWEWRVRSALRAWGRSVRI